MVFISYSGGTQVFGYHDINKTILAEERKYLIILNVCNFLSYFPVISSIIGVARLVLGGSQYFGNSKERKQFGAALISRGVIETFFCGFLLLIPDLIFTIIRAFGKCT